MDQLVEDSDDASDHGCSGVDRPVADAMAQSPITEQTQHAVLHEMHGLLGGLAERVGVGAEDDTDGGEPDVAGRRPLLAAQLPDCQTDSHRDCRHRQIGEAGTPPALADDLLNRPRERNQHEDTHRPEADE